jgi:hypothetical protein
MKFVSRSLSLRSLACPRLVLRLPVSTNTTSSIFTPLTLTLTHHYSTPSTMPPPPPPKRKWNRPRNNGPANGSAPGTPTTPLTAITQQPKRPRVEDAAPKPEGIDVKQMYSTSAGDASAKPFSTLSGKLDKSLLDGLDKMGFE